MSETPEEAMLKAMGRGLHEEERALDARLERLADGSLEGSARAALEADAARDPDLAGDVELHRPLSDTLHARLLSIAQDGLARADGPSAKSPEGVELDRPAPPPAPKAVRRWTYGAGLALAAGLALFVLSPDLFRAPPTPLPPFTFSAKARDAKLRGDAPAPAADAERRPLREDSEVSLVMRSDAAAMDGEIRARLFALDAMGAHEIALEPTQRNAAFLFRGTAAALSGGRRGPVDLVMRVERAGLSLAPPPDTTSRTGPGWMSTGVRLEIRPRPE